MTDRNPDSPRTANFPIGVQLAVLLTGAAFTGIILLVSVGTIIAVMGGNSGGKSPANAVAGAPQAGGASAAYSLDLNPVYRHNPDSLIAEGKQSFDVLCVACHQLGGAGKIGLAPNLRNRDFLALASDDFLYRTIIAGRPGTAMTPWAHLERGKVEGLIAYLRSGETGNPRQIAVDPGKRHPGNADEGAGLYLTYCSGCHGGRGSGYAEGGSGPGIGLPGFLANASDDYIFQTVKHGRAGSPMKSFIGSAALANLSPEEVANIISYLRSGDIANVAEPVVAQTADPGRGEMHFNANCMACHQQGGTGKTGFAPSIRNRDFLAIASDEFIRKTVRNGRPGTAMIQRPDLSDAVLGDIIAYLRALPVANTVKIDVDPELNHAQAGDAGAGQGKYALYCASCHGETGAGYVAGGSGPGIGLPGFLSAASDDYIFHTMRIGRMGTAMRPFLGAAGLANLSEQDAFDIIAYLRSLQFKTASN